MGYMIIVLFILIFQQVGLINLLDRTIEIIYWIMLFVWLICVAYWYNDQYDTKKINK